MEVSFEDFVTQIDKGGKLDQGLAKVLYGIFLKQLEKQENAEEQEEINVDHWLRVSIEKGERKTNVRISQLKSDLEREKKKIKEQMLRDIDEKLEKLEKREKSGYYMEKFTRSGQEYNDIDVKSYKKRLNLLNSKIKRIESRTAKTTIASDLSKMKKIVRSSKNP